MKPITVAALGLALLWSAAGQAASPPTGGRTWHDTKCERYRKAWSDALRHVGPEGLGRPFLDAHAAFFASNCTRRADVCPRSPQEIALANIMVTLSMDFGAASTFAPFYCR